jgi:hypothetical protein
VKRRIEDEVWYRALQVRIRKFGWKLRLTDRGVWVLSHPAGGLVMCRRPPRSKEACAKLAKEMRVQERAIRRNKKEGPWGGSAKKSKPRSQLGLTPIRLMGKAPYSRSTSCDGPAARSMATN